MISCFKSVGERRPELGKQFCEPSVKARLGCAALPASLILIVSVLWEYGLSNLGGWGVGRFDQSTKPAVWTRHNHGLPIKSNRTMAWQDNTESCFGTAQAGARMTMKPWNASDANLQLEFMLHGAVPEG